MLTNTVYGQISDNFSDGDFSNNPNWSGDTSRFEVNSNRQLHLKSDLADTSFLSTRNERINFTEWRFWVKLSFNTSANNYGRVYLVSDKPDLKKSLNGYFIQIGGGDDSIRFCRQEGYTFRSIYCFRQYKTAHSTNILRFRILREGPGNWEAWIDTTGGTNYSKNGSFTDNNILQTAWFGVFCRHTLSNSTKFYFDDFTVGTIVHDTIPPRIVSWIVKDSLRTRLRFSENVSKPEAENIFNYYLTPSGQYPAHVSQDPDFPEAVEISWEKPLRSGTFDSLFVTRIKDISGNMIRDTTFAICYYLPRAFDVLIHEIMADAEPQVELPPGEYVELYNRTDFPINLENWTFHFGKSVKNIPTFGMAPHGFLLIVKDSSLFSRFGPCLPLFTSGTSLSNTGTTLVLRDDKNHIIHALAYDDTWYGSSFKNEGGWSLEMKDPSDPCGCAENWTASIDPSGGSPGRLNSVFQSIPDFQDPFLVRGFFEDSLSLNLVFSEPLDSVSLFDRLNYIVMPDEISPDSIFPLEPFYNTIKLKFHLPFQKGFTYGVFVANAIRDCSGNPLDTARNIKVAIPVEVSPGDLIINELLFNPYPGGSRFVELFNRSSKVVDLKTLILAKQDSIEGIVITGSPVSKESFLLFPFDYIAISPSPDDVLKRYPGPAGRQIIKPDKFPTLSDKAGTVVIAKRENGEIIDRLDYHSDMHFALLSSAEGVSLERLNPERPSSDRSNWHSASETNGFATPAYQNSQFFPEISSNSEISVSPLIFSPDNDGKDDAVNLYLRPDGPGFQADVVIYDSRGRRIKKLAENVLLGEEGVFTWDGISQGQTRAPVGIYILFIQLIKPDGTVKQYKKAVVLAGKL